MERVTENQVNGSKDLSIGEKITKLRKSYKLTQDEFGESIGVTRQAVSYWEKGISIPKADKIDEICRVYRLSASYFFGETDKKEIACTVSLIEMGAKENHGRSKLKTAGFIIGWTVTAVLLFLMTFIAVSVFTAKRSENAYVLISTRDSFLLLFIGVLLLILLGLMTFLTIKYVRKQRKHKNGEGKGNEKK